MLGIEAPSVPAAEVAAVVAVSGLSMNDTLGLGIRKKHS